MNDLAACCGVCIPNENQSAILRPELSETEPAPTALNPPDYPKLIRHRHTRHGRPPANITLLFGVDPPVSLLGLPLFDLITGQIVPKGLMFYSVVERRPVMLAAFHTSFPIQNRHH